MLLLDVLFRYPTVTLALTLAILALRDATTHATSRYAALLCLSIAAILLGTAPPELQLPIIPFAIVRFFDVISLGCVWWFGRSMFEDDFKLGVIEWAVMSALALPIITFRLFEFGYIDKPPNFVSTWVSLFSLVLMGHLIISTLRGRRDDMVESRRKMRVYFVIGAAIAGASIVCAEILFYRQYPDLVDTFRAAIILPMVFWGMLMLTKFTPEKLDFQATKKIEPSAPAIDPRDLALHRKLVDLMTVDKFFAEPGLTIRTLAEKLKTPEHQLRALINKGMGYRNFSGFLNHYRIQAVKDAMAQSENARIPVLTLAMDVGFNSLAPFNRAFREIVGQTPTQYRAKNINKNNDPSD